MSYSQCNQQNLFKFGKIKKPKWPHLALGPQFGCTWPKSHIVDCLQYDTLDRTHSFKQPVANMRHTANFWVEKSSLRL